MFDSCRQMRFLLLCCVAFNLMKCHPVIKWPSHIQTTQKNQPSAAMQIESWQAKHPEPKPEGQSPSAGKLSLTLQLNRFYEYGVDVAQRFHG
jgi:hypothetical protein